MNATDLLDCAKGFHSADEAGETCLNCGADISGDDRPSRLVTFTYKNHRGEVEERRVEFIGLLFNHQNNPEFGYQPGWFLHGRCLDRNAIRSFALSNIILPDGVKQFILEPGS